MNFLKFLSFLEVQVSLLLRLPPRLPPILVNALRMRCSSGASSPSLSRWQHRHFSFSPFRVQYSEEPRFTIPKFEVIDPPLISPHQCTTLERFWRAIVINFWSLHAGTCLRAKTYTGRYSEDVFRICHSVYETSLAEQKRDISWSALSLSLSLFLPHF